MTSNIHPSHIQVTVMRRVRAIHALKPLFTATVASVALFVLALWGIGREVWVSRVLKNMPSVTNVGAVIHFYLVAFLDTRFIVQALSIVAVATFIWLIYSFAKTVTIYAQFA